MTKITNEYHTKGNKAEDLTLRRDNEAVESGEEEKRDHRIDKKTNKSMIWGLAQLVGEISAGTTVLHCHY